MQKNMWEVSTVGIHSTLSCNEGWLPRTKNVCRWYELKLALALTKHQRGIVHSHPRFHVLFRQHWKRNLALFLDSCRSKNKSLLQLYSSSSRVYPIDEHIIRKTCENKNHRIAKIKWVLVWSDRMGHRNDAFGHVLHAQTAKRLICATQKLVGSFGRISSVWAIRKSFNFERNFYLNGNDAGNVWWAHHHMTTTTTNKQKLIRFSRLGRFVPCQLHTSWIVTFTEIIRKFIRSDGISNLEKCWDPDWILQGSTERKMLVCGVCSVTRREMKSSWCLLLFCNRKSMWCEFKQM